MLAVLSVLEYEFQSLIGILQTVRGDKLPACTPENFNPSQVFYKPVLNKNIPALVYIDFNPSQVFYKPYRLVHYLMPTCIFQSLIGILQTTQKRYWSTVIFTISIPHRYSTNVQSIPYMHVPDPHFNPSQVFYKRIQNHAADNTFYNFNPSQVFYKPLATQ